MVSDEVVVFDNLSGKIHLIVLADPSLPNAFGSGRAAPRALRHKLRAPYTGAVGQPYG